ncbi:ATP-dependent DNA helicase [Octopus vulgaris]|uniref:ATP-dependent DNA helicase n=1 Tax=Octopus vulgaris TaxID=6645 RepID=A0AA36AQG9_OCTVU|nr:ATP-dependent DNA helicase [Octopus vulgaris]
MLLHVVTGPKSFADLRTVDGIICVTYRKACLRRGLLNDDHLHRTLAEASNCKLPWQMRRLFCSILIHCNPSNPLNLCDGNDDVYNEALIDMDRHIRRYVIRGLSEFHLPTPVHHEAPLDVEYMSENNYNIAELTETITRDEPRLLPEQREIYNEIIDSVRLNQGKLFFLNAPGGTGKTFVINLILAKLRAERRFAIACASSGIAATLLQGGRTAHSAFKLPMDIGKKDNPICNIDRSSSRARLLRECSLFIWDEATMSNKAMFEALDRTLQDLHIPDIPEIPDIPDITDIPDIPDIPHILDTPHIPDIPDMPEILYITDLDT